MSFRRALAWGAALMSLLGGCSRQTAPSDAESLRDASYEAATASDGSGDASSAGAEGMAANVPDATPFDASGCTQPPPKSDCSAGWCRIPAGCFVIGSPDDEWGRGLVSEQQAKVTLSHGFSLAQTEVTQAAWKRRGFANPSGTMPDGTGDCTDDASCPVGNVSWYEAAAYANALSEAEQLPACYALSGCTGVIGKGMACTGAESTAPTIYECSGYRLPTDAEWEYAARAGTRTAFYSGDITRQAVLGNCYADPALEGTAWYCHNAQGKTHPVALKSPNAFGLLDMAGNVEEWVSDRHLGAAAPNPSTDPGAELAFGTLRIVRGGLFNAWAALCRSASRLSIAADQHGPGLGFRLARSTL